MTACRFLSPCFLLAGASWFALTFAEAAERVALVIGNGAYLNGNTLENPVNDARLIGAALEEGGFEVTVVEDAGLAEMEQALVEFRRSAEGADAAWFYFAGHGIEVKGSNFLVPVDAEVEEEFQVKHKTFPLDLVLSAMDEAATPLKVIVLDCCRNNPFGRSWHRSGAVGLGQVTDTPTGTIIAFAAAPGKTALDGTGGNSPYCEALATALLKPDLEIDQVFKETGRLVLAATERQQQPWINSSFYDQFVVKSSSQPTPEPAMEKPKQPLKVVDAVRKSLVELAPFELPLEQGQREEAETLTPDFFSFPVGKWPERLALTEGSLWVSESGQRSIGAFDVTTGELVDRIDCGRLPVPLVGVGNEVYAGVCTDGQIFRCGDAVESSIFGKTGKDYPQALASDGETLYVLVWVDGASDQSAVIRYDLASGQSIRSGDLGSNAADLAIVNGNLWVSHTAFVDDKPSGNLTRLDPETLEVLHFVDVGIRISRLVAAEDRLVGAGGWDESGVIMAFDSVDGSTIGFGEYPGKRVEALATHGGFAAVADDSGTVSIYSVSDMRAQRHLELGAEAASPHDLLMRDGALFLTVHHGDEGVVYRVANWEPTEEVVGSLTDRFLEAESVGGVELYINEEMLVQLLGDPDRENEPVFEEASGLYVSHVEYDKPGLRIQLFSSEDGGERAVNRVDTLPKSTASTVGQIRLGMSLEQVRTVYGALENEEEGPIPADPGSEEFTFVAGSIYGGLMIQFADGRVAGMTLGAVAE